MLSAGADQEKRQPAMTAWTFFSKRACVVMATAALPVVASTVFALSVHSRTSARLQDIADDAALAGVNLLAANVDQARDITSREAIAAAKAVIASQPGIVQKLQPSVEGLTMSVVVEDTGKDIRASATARYVPAKDGRKVPQAVHLRGYTAAAL
jgi:hypothetical protein